MADRWSPGWAWLILTVFVALYVAVFDLHAVATQAETMSGRFRDWLFNPYTGPFIAAGWVGLFVGLTYHWFLRKARP